MMRWPKSRFPQALIAFAVSAGFAAEVFSWTVKTHLEQYNREYPDDGQNGLGAMMDAFEAGGFTLVGSFVIVFALQRRVTAPSSPDAASFEE